MPRSRPRSGARAPNLPCSTSTPSDWRPLPKPLGGKVYGVDLADVDATIAVVNRAIADLGGLDILVNNAGILKMAPLLEIDPADWDLTFAVNVRAMLITIQVAAKAMIPNGRGAIINMASMGGKVGGPNQAHYAASKAAVISLTQVAAKELGAVRDHGQLHLPGLRADRDGRGDAHRGDGRASGRRSRRSAGSPSPPTSPTWRCSWPPTRPRTAPVRR